MATPASEIARKQALATKLRRIKQLQEIKRQGVPDALPSIEHRELKENAAAVKQGIEGMLGSALAFTQEAPEPAKGDLGDDLVSLGRNAVRFMDGIGKANYDIMDRLTRAETVEQLREVSGEIIGEVSDFVARSLLDVVIAIHPSYHARAYAGDEKAQEMLYGAQERIWDSGGLAPVMAISVARSVPKALRTARSLFKRTLPPEPAPSPATEPPTAKAKPKAKAAAPGSAEVPALADAGIELKAPMLWELTTEQIVRQNLDAQGKVILLRAHRDAVLNAMAEGKNIAPEVLEGFRRDYPELAKKAEGKTAPAAKPVPPGVAEVLYSEKVKDVQFVPEGGLPAVKRRDVGTVGDFIADPKTKKQFSAILDVPVRVVPDMPGGAARTWNPRPKGGKPSAEGIYIETTPLVDAETLLHEFIHADRVAKGRPVTTANELSADVGAKALAKPAPAPAAGKATAEPTAPKAPSPMVQRVKRFLLEDETASSVTVSREFSVSLKEAKRLMAEARRPVVEAADAQVARDAIAKGESIPPEVLDRLRLASAEGESGLVEFGAGLNIKAELAKAVEELKKAGFDDAAALAMAKQLYPKLVKEGKEQKPAGARQLAEAREMKARLRKAEKAEPAVENPNDPAVKELRAEINELPGEPPAAGAPKGKRPPPVRLDPEVAEAFNVSDVLEAPVPKEPFIGQYLASPSNYFSAIPDRYPIVAQVFKDALPNLLPHNPRFGPQGAAMMQQLMLTAFDVTRDVRRHTDRLQEVFDQVTKKEMGKHGEILYDVVAGNPIESIMARTDLSDGMKSAALRLKEFVETMKQDFLDTRRGQLSPTARKLAEKEFRAKNELKGKVLTEAQRGKIAERAQEMLEEWLPDEWGIADYLPQFHIGEFVVRHKGERFGTFRNKADAKLAIFEHHLDNPSSTVADYKLDLSHFVSPDVTRVSRASKMKIVNDIAKDMGIGPDAVFDAMRGKLATRADRQKWFAAFQKRKGSTGYSKDLPFVMNRYIWGYTNWKHWTKLNKQIQPMLEAWRRNGNGGMADYMESAFQEGWGRQYGFSKAFDSWRLWVDSKIEGVPVMGKIPWLRFYNGPFALDRWGTRLNTAIRFLFLDTSPGFHIRNNLQVLQQLLPILSKAELEYFAPALRAKGGKFLMNAADKALIERHGIQYIGGGKQAEASSFFPELVKARRKMMEVREQAGVLAAEMSNQEVAFLTMYRFARERLGLSDALSANYALLRGNLYTQYAYLSVDRPVFTRGPFNRTAFLFRRFGVKAVEQGINEIRSRNFSSPFKWIAMQTVLGGVKTATGTVTLGTAGYLSAKLYQFLRKEYGKDTADAIHYGLAGWFGTDQSYALQLIDLPYGDNAFEKAGRLLGGIPGSTVYDIYKAMHDTKGPEGTTAAQRVGNQLTQRLPALKWIAAMNQLGENVTDGLYDFKDPAGRVKFKADANAVWLQAFSLRPVEAAHEDAFTELVSHIMVGYDEALDAAVSEVLRGGAPSFAEVHRWNAQWPEFLINLDAIVRRSKARLAQQGLTRSERQLLKAKAEIKEGLTREMLFGPEPGTELK